ncbi:MAG: hypothetical protein K0R02_1206 [Rickettsiaceae bacterium]|jgi:hypothetical protein|nr:hypothetical protein [Rickettsiaceae bacterium]
MTHYNNFIEYFEATGQSEEALDLKNMYSLEVRNQLLNSFSTEQLITLYKNTPEIRSICFNLISPSEEEIAKFSYLLKDLNNIEYFSFRLTDDRGIDVSSIFEALNNWNNLKSLNLEALNLTNESAISLKNLIKDSKSIKSLIFHESVNDYTVERFSEAIEHNISLQNIFWTTLNLTQLSQNAFTEALPKNPYITLVHTEFAEELINQITDRNKAYIHKIEESIVKAAKYFTNSDEEYLNAKDIILLLEKEKHFITNKLLYDYYWNKSIIEKMSNEDQENSGLKVFIENLPQNVKTFFDKLENYKADNFLWLKCVSKTAQATKEEFKHLDETLENYRDGNSNKEELKEFHPFPYLAKEIQTKIFKLCDLSPVVDVAGEQSNIVSEQE